MLIKNVDRENGFITLEMSDSELRTVTNLLCKARERIDFNKTDYAVNAELFTAITILHSGRIPHFELNLIKEMQDKSQRSDSE